MSIIKKNKAFFFGTLASMLMVFAVMCVPFVPFFAHAQTLTIPCDGSAANPCDFNKLVQLGSNLMTFLILLSIPIATLAFAWSGILMVTAAGNSGKVEEAKEIFTKVLIGFLFVLSAWLIVRMVTSVLLDKTKYQDVLPEHGLIHSPKTFV